jgi:septum formation protein
MPARRLVLASASRARLRLLRDAGLDPVVVVTSVREDDVDSADVRAAVAALARRKAEAAARREPDALVIGCDSILERGGTGFGKPRSAAEAAAWWRAMRGTAGALVTGHCVIDARSGATAEEVASTVVRFGDPTDAEIDALVATGEPLHVAGGFTIEGRAAPFVEGVDGDPGTVLGLSLPVLRRLLHRLGVEVVDLWC